MAETYLEAKNLVKTYGDFVAVNEVSLAIQEGEILGLLGPNGAGKTTFISMITGLLEPTSGTVTVDGLDLEADTNEVKAKLGLVPQELALYPTLSARDNLSFFGSIYGLGGKDLRQRVDAMLELVELTERAGEAIETYSGGMKRRVNIAAGLLHQPELLFLDEPTVGVDPQSRNAIFEGVEALNRGGMTVIYTTHYMEEAQRLCHRVAIIDEGRIIALDTPAALIRGLGGGILVLGLEDPESGPGRVQEVQERVGELPAVKSARRDDGHLKIETHRFQEALMDILDITNQLDVRITSMEKWEPNLESVFLHLTGKRLRE
ncbi:MAG: ATP-binding cassette domain-containing protein [Anaerolineae bacterium]|nr:ATP-binding cassette domain-containing protein [Anaerolineae bacterium]